MHSSLQAITHRTELDCTTPGDLFLVGHGGYPCAKFNSKSPIVIHGDLLWVQEDHPYLTSVDRMERGAGYDLVNIEVHDSNGNLHQAKGYHYKHNPGGPRIESGNFLDTLTSRPRRG